MFVLFTDTRQLPDFPSSAAGSPWFCSQPLNEDHGAYQKYMAHVERCFAMCLTTAHVCYTPGTHETAAGEGGHL